ncbi:hypothetical protein ARNL5_00609 [Anaerolineae bacterium]|nr:hypothetical protein ARNL5_00609 [Anaerolineae bacterium]
MRALVIAIACLLAAPLCAELARESEAHSALGAIKDSLRVMYERNGQKMDPAWRLNEVMPGGELRGSYFSEADYFLRLTPPSHAYIECRGMGRPGDYMRMEADLSTGFSEVTYPSPTAEARQAATVATVTVFGVLAAGPFLLSLLALLPWKRRKSELFALWMFGSGVWMVLVPLIAGVVFDMFVTEHTDSGVASIVSLDLFLGVLMCGSGPLLLTPNNGPVLALHAVPALVAGGMVVVIADGVFNHHGWPLPVGAALSLSMFTVSMWRYAGATR